MLHIWRKRGKKKGQWGADRWTGAGICDQGVKPSDHGAPKIKKQETVQNIVFSPRFVVFSKDMSAIERGG